MEIVKQATRIQMVRHYLSFRNVAHPGAGFSFDCNAEGKPVLKNDMARANYAMCLAGVAAGQPILNEGIKTERWTIKSPAIGKCECGRKVELEGFTNTCECGLEYNWAGQRLVPRSLWGEETGEIF